MTGLLLAVFSGLADVLGVGSHPPIVNVQRPFLGTIQVVGMIGGFLIASAGVIIFALLGSEGPDEGEDGGEEA
jgi:hypothetical protein